MHRHAALSLAALTVGLALSLGLLLPPAAAQAQPPDPDSSRDPTFEAPPGALLVPGDPPAVGEVLFEDPLTGPGALSAVRCPSGRGVGEFVGEGYILKVTGKCRDTSTIAAINPPSIPGLVVPDGEVRLELKVVTGERRAHFVLGVRERKEPFGAYVVGFTPAAGWASLAAVRSDAPLATLVQRSDLGARVAQGDWNSLAVRLQGQNIWVLLNEQLILSASDPSFERGGVYLGLWRDGGDVNDEQESAVVIRNLRVSKLADQQA